RFRAYQILRKLDGESYRELRHSFARYLVLTNSDNDHLSFSILDESERKAARMMLLDFGEEDQELTRELDRLLREANESEKSARKRKKAQREKENEVLAKMK